MSIAPVSDIVLDVAAAADPVRRREAVDRLSRLATGDAAPPDTFAAALGAKAAPVPMGDLRFGGRIEPFAAVIRRNDPSQVYRDFEAVFLQTYVEAMLPKDDGLFGDAASSGPDRAMFAEQVAKQLARSGRIGIAAKIASHAAAGLGPMRAAAGQPDGAAAAMAAPAGTPPPTAAPMPLDLLPRLSTTF